MPDAGEYGVRAARITRQEYKNETLRHFRPDVTPLLMRRLDRYIFFEILTPGLIALAALTFIVFSQRGGQLLDIIIRQSPTAAEIWAVIATTLPAVLIVTIPMGVLVGILTGFSRLSADSEAIAMRASGISMRRIFRPVLVFATLAWAVTQCLSLWIAPETAANLRTRLGELAMRSGAIELRPRVFYERKDWKLWFEEFNTGNGIEMRNIILVDTKDPDQPEFTFAESGFITLINNNRRVQLTLLNSSRHVVCRVTTDDPEAASRCNPRKYEIMSVPGSNTISRDLNDEARTPPTPAMAETASSVLWEHWKAGTATTRETTELYQRLALPFSCFAFALVALPLGVTTSRGGRSTGIVLSLILMFAYFMGVVGGTRATSAGGLTPFLGTWLPNIAFCILGIILLARSDRQLENRVIVFVVDLLKALKEKLRMLKPKSLSVGKWLYNASVRLRLFRLLDLYVLRGFWFFFAIVLGVFASLFVVVTLFELLPYIIKNNIPFHIVLAYFVFFLPQILSYVIPLAVLLAILINLGTLTKTNQILAVKAGAVSLYRISMPIILMAALLSGVVYMMQDYVLPTTNRIQDEYHAMIKNRPAQTFQDPLRKLVMGSGDRLYHYTFFDSGQNTFANLSVVKLNPVTFQPMERLYAKKATWSGNAWIVEDGWYRRFTDGQTPLVQTFSRKAVTEMDSPSYFTKEARETNQMTYSELQVYVDELNRSGFDVSRLTVDLYRKISFPMVSFIMALIGVPFSFKTGRKGAFYGIGFCLAVGIIYWLTMELFGKLGGVNQLSPFIAAWFPNIIFGASGCWMMLRMKT